jgi:hypothetical protein
MDLKFKVLNMNKFFIIISFLGIIVFSGCSTSKDYNSKRKAKNKETYVFVCKSPTAHAYHKTQNCKGLSKCTHNIVRITEIEAKKQEYNPCKLCYK